MVSAPVHTWLEYLAKDRHIHAQGQGVLVGSGNDAPACARSLASLPFRLAPSDGAKGSTHLTAVSCRVQACRQPVPRWRCSCCCLVLARPPQHTHHTGVPLLLPCARPEQADTEPERTQAQSRNGHRRTAGNGTKSITPTPESCSSPLPSPHTHCSGASTAHTLPNAECAYATKAGGMGRCVEEDEAEADDEDGGGDKRGVLSVREDCCG